MSCEHSRWVGLRENVDCLNIEVVEMDAKRRRWEGVDILCSESDNEGKCHVGTAGPRVDCVDEISRSRAGTIKRKSTTVDPWTGCRNSSCHKLYDQRYSQRYLSVNSMYPSISIL